MACNDYRVYNYESYNQTLEIRDCDGFYSSNNIPAAGTAGLDPYTVRINNIGEILSQGTLVLQPITDPSDCYFTAGIHPLTWWGIDVPTATGWGSIYECEEGQS